jgi:hypothetical protein
MTLNLKNSDEGAAKLAGLLFCKWFVFMELVHRTFWNWVCLNRQFETQEKLFLTDIAPRVHLRTKAATVFEMQY